MTRRTLLALLPLACSFGQTGVRVEPNIIYGMYSGTALLLDIYRPAQPNGFGIVYISGSGWHAPQTYDAEPLKGNSQSTLYANRLAAAGYTVFSISHRAAPRFRYPAQVEDAQRAVRFVRKHAARYGIRGDRIGAVGGSSGGHLVLMLGLLDGGGNPDATDAVERESSKVQCVVARAAPGDLTPMVTSGGGFAVVSFLGMPPGQDKRATSIESKRYREASPLTHVSSDDPPVLLMHGDADAVVPFAQSEAMEEAMRKVGIRCRLLRVSGGAHGPTFPGAQNPPDYMGEMVAWLDRHLKQ